MSRGRHAFVYLKNEDMLPGHFRNRQRPQHSRWSSPTAYSQSESAASRDRCARLVDDNLRGGFGYRFRIGKDSYVHVNERVDAFAD
jgi:hypothetical protein